MNKMIILFLSAILLIGCSNEKKELQDRINELEAQLDDCQNGADKLLGFIQTSFDKKEYDNVISLYNSLKEKHPSAPEIEKATNLFNAASDSVKVEKEKEEKKRAAALEAVEKQKAERLASLNKLKKKYDDVSGVTWYYNPYFTHYNNANLTSIYIGHEDDRTWLRLKMSYTGDDWIFFKRAYLSYDGNTIEVPFDDYREKESENSGGAVWEWIDVSADASTISFLKDFAKSSNAKMRLSGKYTKTRTLSRNERRGITDVLNGYEALKAN